MGNVKPTKLERIHKGVAEAFLDILKGEPLVDPSGAAILDENGKVIYQRPKAPMMKVIVEFLKDNGIDSEPVEGGATESLAKKLTQFEGDPLFLTQEEDTETLPEPE